MDASDVLQALRALSDKLRQVLLAVTYQLTAEQLAPFQVRSLDAHSSRPAVYACMHASAMQAQPLQGQCCLTGSKVCRRAACMA